MSRRRASRALDGLLALQAREDRLGRIPTRALRRALLRRILEDMASRPDDVTVAIGVRDRCDHRLANALLTLRTQTHPADLVHPVVVDYGSAAEAAAATRALCRRHDAEYLRVDDAPVWSRSRCLNAAVRRASTTFLLTSDTDVVFSPGYVAAAVAELRAAPLSLVCAPMLDLPPRSVEEWVRAAAEGAPPPLHRWRRRAVRREGLPLHSSIALTWTALVQRIGGYDEFYEGWGAEDDDLRERLVALGLDVRPPPPTEFHLHQWHPRFEGVAIHEDDPVIRRNRAWFAQRRSILRNLTPPRATPGDG